jgi:hypothetical protein
MGLPDFRRINSVLPIEKEYWDAMKDFPIQ